MREFILSIILFFNTISIVAQCKKTKDRESIKKMCGCFEVTFNFTETFNYNEDSLYEPSKTRTMMGLEWAELVIDSTNKISIQHLLQVGNLEQPYVVKHWRQDWLYENRDFYEFNGNNEWLYKRKSRADVRGQWTQKVFEVDDGPRYEGTGTWVHSDEKSYWESTTDAPPPRSEYKRRDYNLTVKGIRHEITDYGWVHDQDNTKVIRKPASNKNILIAKEKGYNTYVRVPDSRCIAAKEWWDKEAGKWRLVRKKWKEIYSRKKDIALKKKVDNKILFKHLFSIETKDQKDIEDVIESFVK